MNMKYICLNENAYKSISGDYKKLIDDLLSCNIDDFSPYSCRQELWGVFSRNKFSHVDMFFRNLEPDDSIEFWTPQMNFVFAMGNTIMRSNYSIDELRENNWSDLFKRDEGNSSKILKAVMDSIIENRINHNVTDWHTVEETKSHLKLKQDVKVKLIAPVSFNDFRMLMGMVKSKPTEVAS